MLTSLTKSLGLLLALGLIVSLTKNIVDYHNKVIFYNTYHEEYQKQAKRGVELRGEIAKNNDYYQLEGKIRQELNLLKPDEVAVILPKPTPSPVPVLDIKKPPYRQWVELLWR